MPTEVRERGWCSSCGKETAITKAGYIRRHPDPKHPDRVCPGAGYDPGPSPARVTKEKAVREAAREAARQEAEANDSGVLCLLTIKAFVRVPRGTKIDDERQNLYDDPGLLYDTLCSVENEHFKLTLTNPHHKE